MLSARRKSDGKTVLAYLESKRNGPFGCLDCDEEVVLKTGRNRINHFAHVNPLVCSFSQGESDTHRLCKLEIYHALLEEPSVTDVVLERPLGTVRPDVYAVINGIKVAIEVQLSSLSVETIMSRTIEYHRKGIYVLWLLEWSPELDHDRYVPRLWEKWLHTAYFGHVYYWLQGLEIVSYSFEPSLKHVPKTTIHRNGRKVSVGGFTRRSRQYRRPIRGKTCHLVKDFGPKERLWWEGGGITVPDAKLFIEQNSKVSNSASFRSFGA